MHKNSNIVIGYGLVFLGFVLGGLAILGWVQNTAPGPIVYEKTPNSELYQAFAVGVVFLAAGAVVLNRANKKSPDPTYIVNIRNMPKRSDRNRT